MKANKQKKSNEKSTSLVIDSIIVIIGIAGIILLAGDEAPDASVQMTVGEWIAIKASGLLLIGVAALIRRAALHTGIIDD